MKIRFTEKIIFFLQSLHHCAISNKYQRCLSENLFILSVEIIYWTLLVFSFLQRRCHPFIRCIKKLLTSRVIMQFFIWEWQNTNIKRGYACVYHLLRSVARSILFRFHISSACFYKQKKFFNTFLTLNAKFFILLTI